MTRARVVGWQPVERISAATVTGGRPLFVQATRWLAPSGVEGTLLATTSLRGRTWASIPPVVSVSTLARDAGLDACAVVVDPRLRWDRLRELPVVICDALALRIEAGPFRLPSVRSGGVERRACRVRFDEEHVPVPSGVRDSVGVPAARPSGSWLGVVTRWPLADPVRPDIELARVPATTRMATGPAAFLRENVDDPILPECRRSRTPEPVHTSA